MYHIVLCNILSFLSQKLSVSCSFAGFFFLHKNKEEKQLCHFSLVKLEMKTLDEFLETSLNCHSKLLCVTQQN